MADYCIETRALSKRFRRHLAVDGLDLQVEPGQTFGFLGPNGSGKSTTIRMLLGLVRPSSGHAAIFGHDVRRDSLAARARVGAMVESPAFYGSMSARKNMRLFGRLSGDVTEKQIDEALDIAGLFDRADDKVKSYSHGMRQRLGIASALTPRPDLVVLDEPTNGLDPQGVSEVRSLIRGLSSEHGLTVFLSSHLLHEVEQVCSHVAVIARGRMLASGPVPDLLGGASARAEIEVERAAEAADLLGRQSGVAVLRVNGNRCEISVEGPVLADLNRLLVEHGFRVSAIERRRQSLEDFYLKVTREERPAG